MVPPLTIWIASHRISYGTINRPAWFNATDPVPYPADTS